MNRHQPVCAHILAPVKGKPPIHRHSRCDLPSYPRSRFKGQPSSIPPWLYPYLLLPTPPGSASPQEPGCPLIWSDTGAYPRRRSSRRRLSYPRVPVVCSPLSLCSYGSVTIEQSHKGAPLLRLPHPQRSHRNSLQACNVLLVFLPAHLGAGDIYFQRWLKKKRSSILAALGLHL